ncbi:triple tyrosine motif-containing protein [Belliella pelovolcani]|uniref:Regulatory protein, luxR family n=1 Tax=Belliella pelovolcani TaxID=529505 RepID=A0A1N7PT80_9BACT|nr:triple tyrosine motif-containing protein [Belliella pelovolcani]SIT13760.1 regulatory protein, luxR family [Belliella pelovolcani]
MKKVYLLLVFLFLQVSIFAQDIGLPFSKYYSSQEYQGGIQNYAITQSTKGLIYIANNYGLLEYDGTTWRRYALPSGTKLRHVQLDEDGQIYVTGQGDFGYFTPNRIGQLEFQSLKNKLPEAFKNLEEVWKVYITSEEILFCTTRQIFVFDKKQNYRYDLTSKSAFESFHFQNGQLYVNEVSSGLYTLQNGQLVSISNSELFSDHLVTGVLQLSSNQQIVLTRDAGVFELQSQEVKKWKDNFQSAINTALRLKNGNIAIGTQSNGLYILSERGATLLYLNNNNGLNNNSVVSLFEDLSGNLWIGHNNGLTLVELSKPFRKINQFSGLTGTGYHAILYDDKTYFGTNNGVYVQNSDPKAKFIENSTGQVYQLKSIENHLLIAHNDGAFVIKGNQANKIEGPTGIWNFQRLKNHPNLILVGGYNGIYLYEINHGEVRFLRQIKGFSESSRIIEQDDKGNIWVAHGYKGIYKLQLDQSLESVNVTAFGPESGLPTNTLNNVWKLGNRLIFTTQAGIFKFNDSDQLFERDPFFLNYFGAGDVIHYMQEDQLGNIYFIAEHEAGVLEKKVDGSFIKHHQLFNQLLPLLNDDLQNIAATRGNEVLFAANEGFIHFSLNQNTYQPNEFPTLLRSVFITGAVDSLIFDGNAYSIPNQGKQEAIKIPYQKANIRFESSNPTPNNEKDLEFQFWLEGLEPGYGEWIEKREKAYTNLREGKYTFHVRSRNLYGELAEETSWDFEVLPPWYRSQVAYGVYFLMLCIFGFTGYLTIEKKYQKRARQLKSASRKVIEAKDSELRSSQEELERLKNEKLKQEIQLKDKELASATMHLITKNGFIDHVKGNLTGIIKKSKNQEVKNEIQKVIKNIEKNIAEDEDWEQFEIHFDQVHGDFMSRFKKIHENLSPQEIKLSAYLRMNLSTKEIAYLMNISVRGVEIARYRLRKKLNLTREDNLQEFILKF